MVFRLMYQLIKILRFLSWNNGRVLHICIFHIISPMTLVIMLFIIIRTTALNHQCMHIFPKIVSNWNTYLILLILFFEFKRLNDKYYILDLLFKNQVVMDVYKSFQRLTEKTLDKCSKNSRLLSLPLVRLSCVFFLCYR